MKNIDGLFPFLDWILKKTNNFDKDLEIPSTFMINRWLSMSTIDNCKIINETLNKWGNVYSIYGDMNIVPKFLRTIINKYNKRLIYIKKKKKTEHSEKKDDIQDHIHRECSKREIIFQKNTIEELKLVCK
jgi:hypothetical protein